MLFELVLALFDADGGSGPDLHHVVGMFLTQATLFAFHTGYMIAVQSRIHGRTQLELAQKPPGRRDELRTEHDEK